MSESAYILAVDGGGSKTAAALLTATGEAIAACRTGPSNLYRNPAAGLAAIAAAWREVCAQAGLDPKAAAPCTVISAGLAGISGAEQRRAFAAAFSTFARRCLSSDGYIAFIGTFGREPGALLVVGTGVVAHRRQEAGGPVRILSGWGFPVADRGGGAWLGLRLVGEHLDHLDGAARIAASPLHAEVERRLGREREAVLAWLKTAAAADFAALAPPIVAAAEAGDPLAVDLMDEGDGHLRRLARALQPTPEAPLCLSGGLAAVYRPRLVAALGAEAVPDGRVPEPLRGAWRIAKGQIEPEFTDVR